MQRPVRLHFSEVNEAEAGKPITGDRYFPNKSMSEMTQGVDHVTPLREALKELGWVMVKQRDPYMYQGRVTAATEYTRGRSFLTMTTYREDTTVWAFVKIRGFGSDVIQLREWMITYESSYGRMRA